MEKTYTVSYWETSFDRRTGDKELDYYERKGLDYEEAMSLKAELETDGLIEKIEMKAE